MNSKKTCTTCHCDHVLINERLMAVENKLLSYPPSSAPTPLIRNQSVENVWRVVGSVALPDKSSSHTMFVSECVEAENEEEARYIAFSVFIKQSLEDGDWDSDDLTITHAEPVELPVWYLK